MRLSSGSGSSSFGGRVASRVGEPSPTMIETQRLTTEVIRELAETGGPCTTIVLAGNEAGETAIQLNHALRATREECERRGIDPEPYVASIEQAARDMRGETKNGGPIAILRSPALR